MKERNMSVEGMRGIAAVMVVLSHFMVAFYPASYWGNDAMSHIASGLDIKLSQSPFSIFYAGNFGVCLFFVIGGFGIAS